MQGASYFNLVNSARHQECLTRGTSTNIFSLNHTRIQPEPLPPLYWYPQNKKCWLKQLPEQSVQDHRTEHKILQRSEKVPHKPQATHFQGMTLSCHHLKQEVAGMFSSSLSYLGALPTET